MRAGIEGRTPVALEDLADSDWEALIALNLRAAMVCSRALVPAMKAAGWGRIVNIASDAARVGSSGEAVYAACKGGLVAFTKTLAREHARHGITLNVVCPGPTDTALLEWAREAAPRMLDPHPELARQHTERWLGGKSEFLKA